MEPGLADQPSLLIAEMRDRLSYLSGAARVVTWQPGKDQIWRRTPSVAGRVAIILVRRLTKSEASCTGSGPRLICMSMMSRVSSFETCFITRLAWGALFKHWFQQNKGSGGCITQTDLPIASARCICNSYAVNRYDNRLSSYGDPTIKYWDDTSRSSTRDQSIVALCPLLQPA